MKNKWAASHEKVPNVLSRCHTPAFQKKKKNRIKKFKKKIPPPPKKKSKKLVSYQNPSFGMTMTQDIRDLFA